MAIDTMAKLRQVYPPPAARAGLKVLDHLDLPLLRLHRSVAVLRHQFRPC